MRTFFYYFFHIIGHTLFILSFITANILVAVWIFEILDYGIFKALKENKTWYWIDFLLFAIITPIINIVLYELWRKLFIDID